MPIPADVLHQDADCFGSAGRNRLQQYAHDCIVWRFRFAHRAVRPASRGAYATIVVVYDLTRRGHAVSLVAHFGLPGSGLKRHRLFAPAVQFLPIRMGS